MMPAAPSLGNPFSLGDVMSDDLKCVALMSFPRCIYSDMLDLTVNAVKQNGFDYKIMHGAYWHQCMQNMLEEALEDGYDWACTIDGDTAFTPYHLGGLKERLGDHPEIDALAALQLKRHSEETLMTIKGDYDGTISVPMHDGPIKVNTAHFGLTLFRMESFRDLPKPWFLGAPNSAGSYRDNGRTDADIAFWHVWGAHGRSLYVDPDVRIGHMQLIVSDVDELGNARHRLIHKWRQQEMPAA